jgi:hypothetical protein
MTISNLIILLCAFVVLACAVVMYRSKPKNPMYAVYFGVGLCLVVGFIFLNLF